MQVAFPEYPLHQHGLQRGISPPSLPRPVTHLREQSLENWLLSVYQHQEEGFPHIHWKSNLLVQYKLFFMPRHTLRRGLLAAWLSSIIVDGPFAAAAPLTGKS